MSNTNMLGFKNQFTHFNIECKNQMLQNIFPALNPQFACISEFLSAAVSSVCLQSCSAAVLGLVTQPVSWPDLLSSPHLLELRTAF